MSTNTQDKETSDLIGQRKQRIEKLQKIRDLGIDPYPADSHRTHTLTEVVEKFDEFENKEVTVVGRIMSWRAHGHLIFADIHDQDGQIQIYIKDEDLAKTSKENQTVGFEDLGLLDIGDFIQVTGTVTKTQRGEISVAPGKVAVLEKSIRPLPNLREGITDKEERFRRRYVDMTVHKDVRDLLSRRAAFWQAHREFLNARGFKEINIPILEHIPGGGDAVPFTTHMNAIDEDFFLRISHELPLKRLIGGGFEKVYDIGARFRNEGLSDEHLPEHVAMEFYWAYADWKDGMQLIQELFNYILDMVYHGRREFTIRGFNVNFTNTWEVIDFNEIFQKHYGVKDIYNIQLDEVIQLLERHNLEVERGINIPRGVDKLWKQIRKTIAGPTFLINHPKYLSPLQKPSLTNPHMVERFQPIIAGTELGNGWSEVNDAIDQYDRFMEQQKLRDGGDAEAQWLDIDYVEMLEYGMPPTFGWGHSERVFWFLEDVTAREGVPFPQLKFHVSELTKKIYPEVDFGRIRDTSPFDKAQDDIGDKAQDDIGGKAQGVVDKVQSGNKSLAQDFSNRIVIVVNKKLEGWQIMNSVGHISAYLGMKLDGQLVTGGHFVTKDGKNHPRNSQYPIVILAANPGQMANYMEKVRESGLMYHGFIREMIETTNDTEIIDRLSKKSDNEIEYLGIGIFGDNETVKKLTNKFSLYK